MPMVSFSDTVDERNGLIKYVYPKLREYCLQTYGIPFQYSDMRWGIQEEAIHDHSTVPMCLQELDHCCRLSLATNCVVSPLFVFLWQISTKKVEFVVRFC